IPSPRRYARSAATVATVRPGYGSSWTATLRPRLAAARITAGSRESSGDPRPHQELTTSSTPATEISRICARSTRGSPLEYGPRLGKKCEARSNGGSWPPWVQWTYWPSCWTFEYQG